jgi:hypothetical protein
VEFGGLQLGLPQSGEIPTRALPQIEEFRARFLCLILSARQSFGAHGSQFREWCRPAIPDDHPRPWKTSEIPPAPAPASSPAVLNLKPARDNEFSIALLFSQPLTQTRLCELEFFKRVFP